MMKKNRQFRDLLNRFIKIIRIFDSILNKYNLLSLNLYLNENKHVIIYKYAKFIFITTFSYKTNFGHSYIHNFSFEYN